MTRLWRAAVALAIGLAVLAPPLPQAQAVTSPGPLRVMVVGDSVSQGRAGDFTWRYRLWRTLQAARADVDLVGPLTTLAGGSTAYADPGFDQDHAARWGAALVTDGWWTNDGLPLYVTTDLVSTYHPDVVINDLGLNNLTWYGEAPEVAIALMSRFVSDVRSVDPTATVILGELTQTWTAHVTEYNTMLDELAAGLDRPDARVIAAPKPADYQYLVDTYDTAHPNAQGEVKIARQFSDVLLGLGLPTLPAPPPATYSGRAALTARARWHAVLLRFTTPAGTTRQAVWKRDLTSSGRWRLVGYTHDTSRYRVHPLRPHHRYAFRLRAYHLTQPSSSYSNVAKVRVR